MEIGNVLNKHAFSLFEFKVNNNYERFKGLQPLFAELNNTERHITISRS